MPLNKPNQALISYIYIYEVVDLFFVFCKTVASIALVSSIELPLTMASEMRYIGQRGSFLGVEAFLLITSNASADNPSVSLAMGAKTNLSERGVYFASLCLSTSWAVDHGPEADVTSLTIENVSQQVEFLF